MNRGCRSFKKGDIVKGLLLTVEPYKVTGDKNYRSIVKCTLCNKDPYEIVLSEINRHVFDGCGCQKDRSNSVNWLSFKDWCEQNNQQHLLDAWDYDLNLKTPDKVSSCTSDCYYFKCLCGKHDSSLWKILSLTRHGKTKTLCKKCNSFAQHAIDKFGDDVLDLYWDYDKNIVDPWKISHASKNEIWIKCLDVDYHESYPTLPALFLKGIGCPYCHGNKVHSCDSFAYYYIQKYGTDFLDKYWDYDKNTIDPWSVTVQTNKDYIYLKCKKHGTYPVWPSNFFKFGLSCPECTREQDKSRLQDKVERYILSNYHFIITHEYNCSIVAKNPKTNRYLPYDNDVNINDADHLIIEVMGEQHYNINAGWNRKCAKQSNLTLEEILADLQWRDEYKKQYALLCGYHYLAIPYWTEHDESYKTLIDDKIKSILNNPTLTCAS